MEEEHDDVADIRRRMFGATSMEHRKSLAVIAGKEGKLVAKGSYAGTAIGIFTSGGDAQGRPIYSVTVLDFTGNI